MPLRVHERPESGSGLVPSGDYNLGPEHAVPEAAGDAESVFKIFVMVLHMVLLEVMVKGGKPAELSVRGQRCTRRNTHDL